MKVRELNRRKFLNGTLKAGALTAATTSSLLGSLVHALGSVPSRVPEGKSIYKTEGEVFVDGKLANLDTIISSNSVVETKDSTSFIVFIVGREAHLLRGDSVLRLGTSSKLKEGLELVKGKLLSAFGKRREGERAALHQTTAATIGIRGTAIYAEATDDVTYICTCYGKTRLTANTDSSVYEDVKAKYHDNPRYIYTKPKDGKLIEPAPVINHTNEELMLIEACQGRRVPWAFAGDYDNDDSKY